MKKLIVSMFVFAIMLAPVLSMAQDAKPVEKAKCTAAEKKACCKESKKVCTEAEMKACCKKECTKAEKKACCKKAVAEKKAVE